MTPLEQRQALEQSIRVSRGWTGTQNGVSLPEEPTLERPGAPPGKVPENTPRRMPVEARENHAGSDYTWAKREEMPSQTLSTVSAVAAFEQRYEQAQERLKDQQLDPLARKALEFLQLYVHELCPNFFDRPNATMAVRLPMTWLGDMLGGYTDRHMRRVFAENAGVLEQWLSKTDCKGSLGKLENGKPVLDSRGKPIRQSRSCGLVWRVRSSPMPAGEKVPGATTEDLQALKVDLDVERRNNRTRATANLPIGDRQSRSNEPVQHTMSASLKMGIWNNIIFLKNLTAPPTLSKENQYHDADISRPAVIFAMWESPLTTHGKMNRRIWVGEHANLIARALGDPSSVGNWRKALWGWIKPALIGETQARQVFINCLDRALIARDEGGVRSPARLMSSYLAANQFSEMVKPYRDVPAGPTPKQRADTRGTEAISKKSGAKGQGSS